MLTAAFAFVRGFGPRTWLLIALAVCLAWGGWNRHLVRVERDKAAAEMLAVQQQLAAEREAALQAKLAEFTRRVAELERIDREATERAEAHAAALASARAESRGLRQQLATVTARISAGDPTSPVDCAAAFTTTQLLADMLGSVADRATELAGAADAAYNAGLACERAYDALRGSR